MRLKKSFSVNILQQFQLNFPSIRRPVIDLGVLACFQDVRWNVYKKISRKKFRDIWLGEWHASSWCNVYDDDYYFVII